uniref:Uncharacterized protein n=1 Tax=Eptatretus burgeri TaxID=7764 RepID=A0A8C4R3P7_EPTBU
MRNGFLFALSLFMLFLIFPMCSTFEDTVSVSPFVRHQDDRQTTAVTRRLGGVVELACGLPHIRTSTTSVAGIKRPPSVVLWMRTDRPLPVYLRIGKHEPHIDADFHGRLTVSESWSLHLTNLQSGDEGIYGCRVLHQSLLQGQWTLLTLAAPPEFTIPPPFELELEEGEMASLPCAARGSPSPFLTWHYGNSSILTASDSAVLNLGPVDKAAAGLYVCTATNAYGEVSLSTELHVWATPIFKAMPSNMTVNESDSVLLHCSASGYPPITSYTWRHLGVELNNDSLRSSRLQFPKPGSLFISQTNPTDTGEYECVADNGIGTPASATIFLRVLYPAYPPLLPNHTFIPQGRLGHLRCQGNADPPVLNVDWTRNGHPISSNETLWWLLADGLLMVLGELEAEGDYACIPSNALGSHGSSTNTQVIVKPLPTFTIRPDPEYHQNIGRTLIVPCTAGGDPTPDICWHQVATEENLRQKRMTPLCSGQSQPSRSLRLVPIKSQHHGAWVCEACNPVGCSSTGTNIFVTGTRPHLVTSVNVQFTSVSANISWIAGFDGGYPQWFIVWVKRTRDGGWAWQNLELLGDVHKLQKRNGNWGSWGSTSWLELKELEPGESYDFSVLSRNAYGSGPFSNIVSATRPVPSPPPPLSLGPPCNLSGSASDEIVLLSWESQGLECGPQPSNYSFVVEAKEVGEIHDVKESGWRVLREGLVETEAVLVGLSQDVTYKFRVRTGSGGVVGLPSKPITLYISGPVIRWPPLLVGLLSGLAFLASSLLLSAVAGCLAARRRAHRAAHRHRIFGLGFERSEIHPDGKGQPYPVRLVLASLPESQPDMKGLLSQNDSGPSQKNSAVASSSCCGLTRHRWSRKHSEVVLHTEQGSLPGLGSGDNVENDSPTPERIARNMDGRFVVSGLLKGVACSPPTPPPLQDPPPISTRQTQPLWHRVFGALGMSKTHFKLQSCLPGQEFEMASDMEKSDQKKCDDHNGHEDNYDILNSGKQNIDIREKHSFEDTEGVMEDELDLDKEAKTDWNGRKEEKNMTAGLCSSVLQADRDSNFKRLIRDAADTANSSTPIETADNSGRFCRGDADKGNEPTTCNNLSHTHVVKDCCGSLICHNQAVSSGGIMKDDAHIATTCFPQDYASCAHAATGSVDNGHIANRGSHISGMWPASGIVLCTSPFTDSSCICSNDSGFTQPDCRKHNLEEGRCACERPATEESWKRPVFVPHATEIYNRPRFRPGHTEAHIRPDSGPGHENTWVGAGQNVQRPKSTDFVKEMERAEICTLSSPKPCTSLGKLGALWACHDITDAPRASLPPSLPPFLQAHTKWKTEPVDHCHDDLARRCEALRAEFLDYRRRQNSEIAGQVSLSGKSNDHESKSKDPGHVEIDPRFERATLL